MQAIVLAAGLGRRLGKLTEHQTKCMVELNGRRLIEYTLEALAAQAQEDQLPLVCPTTGQPYIYRPDGVRIEGQPGRMVLFDSGPAHGGKRWALMVVPQRNAPTITCGPVLLSEESIQAALRASTR